MSVPGQAFHGGERRWETVGLASLMFLLPFEPRTPALSLGGLQLTWLELFAGLAFAVLAWTGRRRLRAVARHPALPLLFLAGYAGAHLCSAWLAPVNVALAFKFALRMVAMAVFALLVAAAAPASRRAGLAGLCAGSAVVAALAVAEGVGLRGLDPFLDRFREIPFNVAGSRRASAGSEYPNLAAAFVMYGLLAGTALVAGRRLASPLAAAGALLGGAGLLFTYSRGALVATVIGLLCLAGVLAARRPAASRAPLAALSSLAVAVALFAWSGEIFRLRLASEGTAAWYAASYQPADTTLVLRPGERRTTRVRVANTGRKTWGVGEEFHLSYRWYDLDRRHVSEGARTELPRDVRAGESVELEAVVQAPSEEGRFLLTWDMVHEQTTWFSGQGVIPAAVPVSVSRGGVAPSPRPEAAPPASELVWRPTRLELWRIAVSLWRERPLTGVGSDNFRWLHGPHAGRPVWDSRVFANNTLLEAAATTGSLGLLTLAGSLACTGAAALRQALGAAPGSVAAALGAALLALAAAIAAHGAVDYVLAFTGHYLLFGFVVGAASAREAAE